MWRRLGLTASVALPAILLRLTGTGLSPELTVLIFGAGVVASAILLSWAAEAAQVDISGSLAIAILALIAVLPEYAVDLYFAYTAGGDPTYTQFAAAGRVRRLLGDAASPAGRLGRAGFRGRGGPARDRSSRACGRPAHPQPRRAGVPRNCQRLRVRDPVHAIHRLV
jgi:hypothetical protein